MTVPERNSTVSALASRTLIAVSLCLFSASVTPSQTRDSLRLEQVIRDVMRNNNQVAAAKYMEEAARNKVSSAGAWDDPMLMLGVANLPTSLDFSMDPMTMKMIGLSQSIPLAGQKGLAKKAAQSEASAATQDRYSAEIGVAMAAQFAFADLYYRGKSLSDLASQYGLLEQVVATARGNVAANQASSGEVLSAEAELWRLQTQLLEAEHMVEEAQYNLNILRGLEVTTLNPPLAAPSFAEIPKSPEEWLAEARQHYPPLRKLVHESEAYHFASAVARRMSWPMLNLQANYGLRSGFDISMEGVSAKRDNMVGVQANISLPLFAGRQQKKMALSMDAMRKSVDLEATQKWREIEARLRLLHLTALHLVQTIDLYEKRIVPADQDAFESALAGYSTNRVPYTNLLMYASGIYRDRLALNQTANQLARTLAEIGSYTVDPESFDSGGMKNK